MYNSFFKKINKTSTNNNLKPALFLHIQKTAGTSIVEYAKRYYPSIISHADFLNHKPEEFSEVQFISGHFGYEFTKYHMPNRYSFVFYVIQLNEYFHIITIVEMIQMNMRLIMWPERIILNDFWR